LISNDKLAGIILLSAFRNNSSQVVCDAAKAYKVDPDSIALRVKQEFAAKEKARKASRPPEVKKAA
jgi:ParB family chromosome partitioning protein